MRAIVAIAALWGCSAVAQAASGVALLEDDVLRRNGTAAPLFSFASPTAYRGYAAYAGLPAADGCHAASAVTGTKGEALTFTRATTRFCPTSANEATGVMCASGEVCITSSGTTRGISIFRSGINLALRSEETNNAAWTLLNGGGPVAPTKDSTDSVVAPDGTTTAEVVTWPVVDGTAKYSMLRQQVTFAAAGYLCVWVKKTGGSGSNLWLNNGQNTANPATNCSPTSTWSRCCVSSPTGTVYVDLGANSYITAEGSSPMPAGISAAVWGWHAVSGDAYATPYVKTEGTAVTRNAEVAYFTATAPKMPASIAADYVGSGTAAASGGKSYVQVRVDASDYIEARSGNATTLTCAAVATTQTTTTLDGTDRVACEVTSGGVKACIAGTCTAATGTPSVSASGARVYVGVNADNATFSADGLVSSVCADSSPTGCR